MTCSKTVRSAHSAFMCFVSFSEQIDITYLYGMKWFHLISDMLGVYWAVRTAYLNYRSGLYKLFNPLKPELNPIFSLLALLGAHHFLHVSRIRVKLLTLRRLISYIYGAAILDVSRSHTTTQHSR